MKKLQLFPVVNKVLAGAVVLGGVLRFCYTHLMIMALPHPTGMRLIMTCIVYDSMRINLSLWVFK